MKSRDRGNYLPTLDEIRTLIVELSHDGFAPQQDIFNDAKPDNWYAISWAMHKHGTTWRKVLRDLGLRVNNPAHGKNKELDQPAPQLSKSEQVIAREYSGFKCVPRERIVRKWNPTTKQYVAVGKQIWYQLV